MNTTQLARKSELEPQVERLSKQILEGQQDVIDTDRDFRSCDTKLADLELQHTEACRREALGQSSNRAKVESDISAAYARKKGLGAILEDKRAALQELRSSAAPLEQELAALYRQENLDAQLEALAESVQIGEEEIATYRSVSKSFFQRLAALRDFTDPVLNKAGHDAAERLELAWMGRR